MCLFPFLTFIVLIIVIISLLSFPESICLLWRVRFSNSALNDPGIHSYISIFFLKTKCDCARPRGPAEERVVESPGARKRGGPRWKSLLPAQHLAVFKTCPQTSLTWRNTLRRGRQVSRSPFMEESRARPLGPPGGSGLLSHQGLCPGRTPSSPLGACAQHPQRGGTWARETFPVYPMSLFSFKEGFDF